MVRVWWFKKGVEAKILEGLQYSQRGSARFIDKGLPTGFIVFLQQFPKGSRGFRGRGGVF